MNANAENRKTLDTLIDKLMRLVLILQGLSIRRSGRQRSEIQEALDLAAESFGLANKLKAERDCAPC